MRGYVASTARSQPADRYGPGAGVLLAGVAALVFCLTPAELVSQQEASDGGHPGKPVYDRWCAACHGVDGDGEGEAAAWMLPQPRDFTTALYQVRTTPSGALPTDADIMRVIDDGMPGTAMPGWRSQLSQRQREDLVDYLKTFSRFFEMEDAPAPIEVGRAPGMDAAALEEGAELYRRIECWKCHGDAGRGDGASAPTQTDDHDFPIRPADLTEPWHFNGGSTVEQIYTRLRTGMDGTPMPSFADMVEGGVITDDQLWRLAGYVRSLGPEEDPEAREVVRAGLVEESLPSSIADEAWSDAERYYIPLVGQIIVRDRTMSPAVDGIWVQALHDGETLVMRLAWHDPSRSPDPVWDSWHRLLAEHLAPVPEDGGGGQGPDALTIQFPATMPEGRQLPYFLGGDSREPVYLWRWNSQAEGVTEALGRGLDQIEPLPATDASPAGAAEFDAGEWRLMVRRPLEAGDPQRRLTIPTGEPVPIAFFAQDGSSGETGTRGSVSSWYFLYLDQPVVATVYILPVVATILTALLGLLVVARAQRAARRAPKQETQTLLEGA